MPQPESDTRLMLAKPDMYRLSLHILLYAQAFGRTNKKTIPQYTVHLF